SYLKQLERKGIKSLYLDDIGGKRPTQSAALPGQEREAPTAVISTNDKLAKVEASVRACVECPLHETRTQAVFGVGNPRTQVVFIGEAPGRDEDIKGEPFVGRAGQLLTKIFAAIDLKREDVYITNILKCRPPANRDPQESEVRRCENYLISQIDIIKPKLICALGRVAAQWLLQTDAPLGAMRTGEYYYRDIRVLVTYHPAALLRNPNFKRPAWEDFKKMKAMLDDM
ncbi:MAG: uracil-DNA glycosylase, partial [Candidatus Latescibacterota bacterium]